MRRTRQVVLEIRRTDALDRINPGTQLLVDHLEVEKSVARNLASRGVDRLGGLLWLIVSRHNRIEVRIRQVEAKIVHHFELSCL